MWKIKKCYWIVGKMNARVCSVFSAKIEFQRRMCSICMCDQVWPIKEGIIEIIPFYLCRVIDREMPFVCAFSPSGKNTHCTFTIWFKIGNTKLIINQLLKCIIESFWKKGLTAMVVQWITGTHCIIKIGQAT